MEEGSRRGIYEERIPLCRRRSSGRVQGRYQGCWQELSEEAVRDILEKESLREERAALRGGISFKLR